MVSWRTTRGAIVGGAFGHFVDRGPKNDQLVVPGEQLEAGQSAVIAAATDQFVDDVVDGLRGLGEVDEYFLDVETGDRTKVQE